MAATGLGMIGGRSSSSWIQLKDRTPKKRDRRSRVSSPVSAALNRGDAYKTLRIQPGATQSEVKKAFRRLALQYHPDVCRGSDCGIEFQTINEAYYTLMSNWREGIPVVPESHVYEEEEIDDTMRGINDEDWDLWEEWMGWEGAGIRDYSSHVNPYI